MIVVVPLILLAFGNHGLALGSEGNTSKPITSEDHVLQPRDFLRQFNTAVKKHEGKANDSVLQPIDFLMQFNGAVKNHEGTCIDLSPNCHLNVHNCPTLNYVQQNCRKTCGLCVEYPHSRCSKKENKVYLSPGDIMTISSQNYPNNYPVKSKCKWKFTTAIDHYVGVYCYDFDLQPSNRKGKCFDYLKLNNDKFCGSEPQLVYASWIELFVQFRSDKKRPNYRGFDCVVISLSAAYSTSTTPFTKVMTTPQPPKTPKPPQTPQPGSWRCGVPNRVSRIVGGKETTVNEYPWQAGLIYKGGEISSFCGGSVISTKYVVTAAHCTQAIKNYDISYEVLLGGHCLSSPPSSQMIVAVGKYIQHPKYNDQTLDNDIALIPLKTIIDFDNSDIRPICLPPKSAGIFFGDVATVIGWGTLKDDGKYPDCLMEVDVPVLSNAKCENYIGGGITSNMICAGYDEGKKDSCQGDSGGPLFFDSGCGYEQLGVVSFGFGCAAPKQPGVYARVTKYIDWINSNVGSYSPYFCR